MIGRKKPREEQVEVDKPKGFDDFELRLGDMMRGERATLGKSLLDVQRELKIKASYIAAIENADPTAFETPGFIAGYVRSYARYLGLDAEQVFDMFCAESGFSTAHGMSDEASTIKKSRAAEQMAMSPAMRDPFEQPSTPFVPEGEGFMARVEPGAIGSTLVLVGLLAAIGFGGWTVLNEVQRVSVAPIDEAPVVLTDLDPVTTAATQVPTRTLATSSVDPVALAQQATGDGLDRLYRPKALDTPVLISRDAPISTLNPNSYGAFADQNVVTASAAPQLGDGLNLDDTSLAEAWAVPQVLEQPKGEVKLVAVRPAWVRVRSADGTIVYEGIMDAGSTYTLAQTEEPATLRVGESGAVYFAMNNTHYGPAGATGEVSSGIVLSEDALGETYAVADITQDADLDRVIAELRIQAFDALDTGGQLEP